jgi:hypothetical protein
MNPFLERGRLVRALPKLGSRGRAVRAPVPLQCNGSKREFFRRFLSMNLVERPTFNAQR